MLEQFDGPHTVYAEEGTIKMGSIGVDGRIQHPVQVDIAKQRTLVTLSVGDAVTVEASLDPFLAMAIGEALINAALAVYFRPGGPLRSEATVAPRSG